MHKKLIELIREEYELLISKEISLTDEELKELEEAISNEVLHSLEGE